MLRMGSFVILSRKNKSEIFLVKRSDFPVWEFQGGGIEKGETPEKAAVRESFEETGFKIKIIRKVAEYNNPKVNLTSTFVFEGKIISGKYIPEFKSCEGKWFNINNFPINMTYIKRVIIKDFLSNNKGLIKKNVIPLFTIHNLYLALLYPIKLIKYFLRQNDN